MIISKIFFLLFLGSKHPDSQSCFVPGGTGEGAAVSAPVEHHGLSGQRLQVQQ